MYLDKYKIKNFSTKYMVDIVENRDNAGKIENVLTEMIVDYFNEVHIEKMNSKKNAFTLKTLPSKDVVDDNGLRTFTLGSCDGEEVMVPDIEGFWIPKTDIYRLLNEGKAQDGL